MTISNIERFDEITAQVLGRLYEEFPLPIYLPAADFITSATCYCDAVCADVPSPDARFFEASVVWLGDTGYLRYEEHMRQVAGFRDIVLTARGLEVLKSIPESLSGQTLGERLVAGAKTGGKELALEALRQTLAFGSRLLTGG